MRNIHNSLIFITLSNKRFRYNEIAKRLQKVISTKSSVNSDEFPRRFLQNSKTITEQSPLYSTEKAHEPLRKVVMKSTFALEQRLFFSKNVAESL